MTAVAILVGISEYKSLQPLPCCRTDVVAVAALLESTGRFNAIHQYIDFDSARLKTDLRKVLDDAKSATEIFFYFSGHGHSDGDQFYFCLKDFDSKRPNETGLSNEELHILLREISAEISVKVIDACSSGTLLFKNGSDFLSQEKGSLKNLVQIASCLDSQTSLAGYPLSEFTEKFCSAATKKTGGPVYYTDIISVLRDDYIQNRERSPHFVFQASARETFSDDAEKLNSFRIQFSEKWSSIDKILNLPIADADAPAPPAGPPTLLEMLTQAEASIANQAEVPILINTLFNGLKDIFSGSDFRECFDLQFVEHSDFREPTTHEFIARLLSQEKRQDNFVSASRNRDIRRRNGVSSLTGGIPLSIYGIEEPEEWTLELNMKMERSQLRITLTPKFGILQQIILVITCAPSLRYCYVFELSTSHPRTDWDTFSNAGNEVTRRWYKLNWKQDVNHLINNIGDKLKLVVTDHLNTVAESMSKSENKEK